MSANKKQVHIGQQIETLRERHKLLSGQIAHETDATFLASLVAAKGYVRRKLRKLHQAKRRSHFCQQ
jgi:hypothetical protein